MRKAILMVAACTVLLWVGTAQAAGTPEQKCEQAKLKAQGKYKACIDKSAAGVIGGKPDASTDCQTKFQAALTKADDKATAAMTSCRYIDNGDGTVSDLNTGLVWEKKTNLDSTLNAADPHDADNDYTWSTGANNPDGTAFTDFLYKLNGGTSPDGVSTSGCFTGHCDWRLPTIEELQGILLSAQPCGTSPCIDPTFGPTQSGYYWSATTDAGSPGQAWYVGFYDGRVRLNGKTFGYDARAVRSGL